MRILFVVYIVLLSGVLHLNSQEKISINRIESIPNNAGVNDLLIIDTFVYVAASTGLYKINSKSNQTELLRSKSCDAICINNKDEIWASFEGRYIENINTEKKTNYNSPGITIQDLLSYKGRIWIASNQGVATVNVRTNEMGSSKTERNSDLLSNNIAFLHLDDQAQLWIGTDKGITLINKKDKWKTYEKKLKMEAMHYNHEGLWLVSNKEMWVVDPYNRWYPAAINRGLREGNIRDITTDSTGRLYMASDILVRYDPYEEIIESYRATPGLVSKQCTAVESDRDNRIWLGTASSGLYLIGFNEEAEIAQLSALCIIEENIKCKGGAAKVNLSIYGGKKPYTIQWNDSDSKEKSRNLPAGAYKIIVTDSLGHVSKSNIKIEEVSGMRLSVLETTQESKPGASDAQAKVLVTGGLAPYKIKWPNGEQGSKALQLLSGTHELMITDANGCSLTDVLNIKANKILPELQITKIKVGQTLRINNLFFQADSTDVVPESFTVLDEIYDFLAANPAVVIEIGGHTNNIPSHDYCDKLSTERAKSVAYYLYNKGISDNRIAYKGYGKRTPIA